LTIRANDLTGIVFAGGLAFLPVAI